MQQAFPVTLDRIVLRPLEEGDKEGVRRLSGDPEISRFTRALTYPETPENAASWVDEHIARMLRGESVSLAILEKKAGLFLGAAILYLEPNHARAELGCWLGRPFWSKGYGPEACRALIGYAFRDLKLNKICGYCLGSNIPSIKLMEKLHMRFEGNQRRQLKVRGTFEDLLLFGILAEEWKPVSDKGT